ncbi:hypothetical protein [Streptomyces sp. NPDC053541]|uniref:hypothetical protein n=1 Tax=Streptomyces sp. NPDC053541 TaxID=3365709 RepID=UPI0037D51083
MISEPELVGGPAFPEPAGPTGPAIAPPPPPGPDGPPAAARRRRPWLWALGGAVAASAVWGAGLTAYQRTTASDGPDLRGYRATDPCAAGAFHGLSSALGRRAGNTNTAELDEPGLYRANCVVSLQGTPVSYDVEVTYNLHRATDPRPEFEALMHDPLIGGGDRIDGIGDLAFLNDTDSSAMVLDVVDGQAELRLRVGAVVEWNGEGEQPPEPPKLDPAALRTYLVEDAKELMTALRKK